MEIIQRGEFDYLTILNFLIPAKQVEFFFEKWKLNCHKSNDNRDCSDIS